MGEAVWSATRGRLFDVCRRKYWFKYHLAPTGRRPDSDPTARAAHKLKELLGPEVWLGVLVHSEVEKILNHWAGGRRSPREVILTEARRRLRQAFEDSQKWWREPSKFDKAPPLLDMHYYGGEPLPRGKANAMREQLEQAIIHFFESETAGEVLGLPRDRKEKIEWNASAHVAVDGRDVLVSVKPDLAYRLGDDLVIVDWKTGNPDNYWTTLQLICYALYAEHKWGVPRARVRSRVVYLSSGTQEERLFTDEDHGRLTETIRNHRAAWEELEGQDTLPPMHRFALTEEIHKCGYCPFREICEGARRRR